LIVTESEAEKNVYYDATLSEVWKQRAKQYGARSVVNLSHPPQYFDLITVQQKDRIFPSLIRMLNGSEQTLLDYGCGPGRFTTDLGQFVNHGQVVGFDICQELIDLAPQAANIRYTSSSPDLTSPQYRDFFDVIWICLVLGGIPDVKCTAIAADLMKDLKPNGLLFLVEHTSNEEAGSPFWKFRPLAQYKAMFPQVALEKIGQYLDLGQEVTIMAGRKTA
jgi:2-polyprenyl-3-methyl-5-hydroxy-6-metoxy-1,4-benzoquinol methylase